MVHYFSSATQLTTNSSDLLFAQTSLQEEKTRSDSYLQVLVNYSPGNLRDQPIMMKNKTKKFTPLMQ